MIGRLQGILLLKHPPELMIDVSGVGYELQASMNTFYHLPKEGEKVTLFTHFVVREDAQLLYGFFDLHERALFRELIKVSGIGPKVALAILSSIDPDGFVACVNANDVSALVRMPGIGKKTAERLIVEMRGRLKAWEARQGALFEAGQAKGAASAAGSKTQVVNEKHDAFSALISLGYKPQDAQRVINKVFEENLSSEEMIRRALKLM